QIKPEHVIQSKKDHPNAKVLVHPECIREVRNLSDVVGSTSYMYNTVKNSSSTEKEFIIGTESGLMERMAQDFPDKRFYLVMNKLVCYNMKKNTIELVKYVLEHLDEKMFEVKVPSDIAKKALIPIERMLEFS
ncbi:unnamed protein product, partial [marine sediment metagenome]